MRQLDRLTQIFDIRCQTSAEIAQIKPFLRSVATPGNDSTKRESLATRRGQLERCSHAAVRPFNAPRSATALTCEFCKAASSPTAVTRKAMLPVSVCTLTPAQRKPAPLCIVQAKTGRCACNGRKPKG